MFTAEELGILAATCESEMHFLSHVERRGIATAQQYATVSSLRAKVLDQKARVERAQVEEAKKEG